MLSHNARQLATNCTNGRSLAEKRFFDVLYRWSRVGCAERAFTRPIHTRSARTPPCSPLHPRTTHVHPRISHSFSSYSPNAANDIANTEKKELSDKVRHIMRAVPNPVVVLTTSAMPDLTGDSSDENEPNRSLYRGMTLSSFTTLSMEPQPLITFNIRFPSRTLSALTQRRRFLLHILEPSPEGATLATTFTKGNMILPHGGTEAVHKVFDDLDARGELKHSSIRNRDGSAGGFLPVITSNGVKYTFRCMVLGEGDRAGGGLIRVGDHVLVIARVNSAFIGAAEWSRRNELEGRRADAGSQGTSNEGAAALSYAFGNYGRFEAMAKVDVQESEGKESKE